MPCVFLIKNCLLKVDASNKAKEKIGAAMRVGGQGNVWAALDLIDYDKRVEPAIMHLFGNHLICRYNRSISTHQCLHASFTILTILVSSGT